MDILLVTFGSRGDLNPFIGLGISLKKSGANVTLISWSMHEDLVKREGLNFIGADGERHHEMMNHHSPADWYHPHKGTKLIAKYVFLDPIRPVYNIINQFDPKKTIIVSHPIALGARLAAEKNNIPLVSICLQPSMLWSNQKPVYSTNTFINRLPLLFRRMIMKGVDKWYLDRLYAPELNKFRSEIGLPKIKNVFSSWMLSPERIIGLFPDWFANASDWPSQTKLAGFTLYDEEADEPLSSELQEFLAAGAAPLVFTYGSMMTQGHDFFSTSVEAVKKLGCRALLLTQAPEQLPEFPKNQILHVPYVPFRKLLPHVAGLIHHGGIGTTMQALAAGIPQLIVPISFDQPDNAAHIIKLGAGLTIPKNKYSTNNAVHVIQKLLNCKKIKAASQEYQKKINFIESENKVYKWIEERIKH